MHPSSVSTSSSSTPTFSYFSGAPKPLAAHSPAAVAPDSPNSVVPAGAAWTNDNAAVSGLSLSLQLEDLPSVASTAAAATAAVAGANNSVPAGDPAHGGLLRLKPLPKGRGPVNEVVCGALMLAYERAGRWQEAVGVLDRARALGERLRRWWLPARLPPISGSDVLCATPNHHAPTIDLITAVHCSLLRSGISPNTVMYNTAISALGKALQVGGAPPPLLLLLLLLLPRC